MLFKHSFFLGSIMLKSVVKILATWFYSGLIPKAPGTLGSLLALPFAFLILKSYGVIALGGACLIIFLIGLKVADLYEQSAARKDPQEVVIDEVLGQWLALLPASLSFYDFGIGFVLFRFFDITKIWPAKWADQKLTGGLGIMLDDVIAGCYAAFFLGLIKYFALI